MSYPPYPTGGGGGYPQGPQQGAGNIGFNVSAGGATQQYGQPFQPGYPPQQGFPSQQPGYPSQPAQPGYPPQGGYPAPSQPGYPTGPQQPGQGYPQQPGYPQQQPSYPQQQPSYPQQQPGYPQQQPGYPSQQSGYPPQQSHQPSYPPQQGYPPQQQGGYPPQQQGGYPPQQQGQHYPAQQGGGGGAHSYPPYQGGQQPLQYPSGQMSYSRGQGSLRPTPGFNAQADAEKLRKAMKGFGTNEQAIIDVLCKRTNPERQQIALAYKTMYGKDLIENLRSELSGDFEDTIVALLYTPAAFDARELRHAMQGIGTNEATLTEILCTRTNAEINAIKQEYRRLFRRELERDLVSETSFHFKRLLVSLSAGGRDESNTVDVNRARQQAQDLLKAGVKKLGTDEGQFNATLVMTNPAQLQCVMQEYEKLAGHSVETAVKREFSGDIENGLLVLVQCGRSPASYFAKRAQAAMAGMGTRDRDLIRVVITRAEVDMMQIRQEFQRQFKRTLEAAIGFNGTEFNGDEFNGDEFKSETSGDYKKALVSLVQGNH